VGFAPSLLISSGFVDVVVLDSLFSVASLVVALLLFPPSLLVTPTFLFVMPSLILVPGVPFSLIPDNVLLGSICAPPVFDFGVCL